MKKNINVVGAVIYSENKILCAQRNENMSLPLKWEFPGGKIEKGETEEEALIVNLTTYKCTLNNEMPTLTEHKEIKWLEPDELAKLDWAPADIPTVEIIVKGKN